MTLALTWLRLELRRRWRSLVVLALLVAFATATVLAAVAGARRGATAADRLAARTRPATAVVLPNRPNFDWDKVRALPQVETLSTAPVTGVYVSDPKGVDWWIPGDHQVLRTIERPAVLDGRLADPTRVDEVVVTPLFPRRFHRGVGDTVTLRLGTPEQVDASPSLAETPAKGPVIRARIVGVVRSQLYSDGPGVQSSVITSAALFDRYRANIMGTKHRTFVDALVRLNGGDEALPEFHRDLTRVIGGSDVQFLNMAEQARHRQKVNAFEAACLLALGLAALLAAALLIGQAVVRYAAATAGDLRSLRVVGITPQQTVVAATAGPLVAALAGTTFGAATAVVASRWMPIGAAAYMEPDPGIDVDWMVLPIGWLLAPLAVIVVATAWLLRTTPHATPKPRRSAVAAAAALARLPVPIVVGTRFVLEMGRAAKAPARPALFGAIVDVLGVIAALTFSAGVSDAAVNPERFGQTYQADAFLGTNGEDMPRAGEVLPVLAQDADVTAINNARVSPAEASGRSVILFTFDPVGAPLRVVLTQGRMPVRPDEVVLGPTTAALLDAAVGTAVEFKGNKEQRRLTVTGLGFVPQGWNGYADGGWLTPAGYDRLFTGFEFHVVDIAFRPGADPDTVAARLRKATAAATGAPIELDMVRSPTELGELKDVRVLPIVLASFLAVLAVGAVGHALVVSVHRRRRDLAVLRAIGMTPRQSRIVVLTQAVLLASIGLLFGVPLGVALGRSLWRLAAENTPVFYEPPWAVLTLALVAPVALVVANLLAAWPARRVANLRIAEILRTE